jgi:hypothetical protein
MLIKEPKLVLNDDNAGKPEGHPSNDWAQTYFAIGNSIGDR